MPEDEKIAVEGAEYSVDTLSDQAKAIVESLRFVERELSHLNARTAVYNTAKTAYIMELKKHLPIVTN
jgi:hypothetical protein